jgi:hypothetical protein
VATRAAWLAKTRLAGDMGDRVGGASGREGERPRLGAGPSDEGDIGPLLGCPVGAGRRQELF